MTSSLTFQKLLYFHGTFDILYAILMISGIIHKITVRDDKLLVIHIVSLVMLVAWMPLEYFRIRFGYKGNINETFSEIVAFIAFSFFFVLPLSAGPVVMFIDGFLPHEKTCIAINVLFLVVEFVTAIAVMSRFYKT